MGKLKTHGLNLRGKMVLPPKKTKEKAKINKGYGQVGVPLSVPNDERVKPKASKKKPIAAKSLYPVFTEADFEVLEEATRSKPESFYDPTSKASIEKLLRFGLVERLPKRWDMVRRTRKGWLVLCAWVKAGFVVVDSESDLSEP